MVSGMPSRRDILRSSGVAAGISGISIGIGMGSDDSIKIVTGKREDTPTTTNIVSEEWYDHVQHVREIQSELKMEYYDNNRVESVRRTTTDSKIGGLNGMGITIGVTGDRVFGQDIPDQIESIPIEVEEAPDENEVHFDDHYHDNSCRTKIVDCIQGGDYISSKYTDNPDDDCSDGWGKLSITSTVYKGGTEYVMTSAHGFVDDFSCGTDITGESAYQGHKCNSSSYEIGEVDHYDYSYDWALVNKDNLPSGKSSSSSVVGEYARIQGHVTEDGIDYLASSNETVYNYGRRTCKTEGKVLGIGDYSRCYSEEYVGVTANAAGGDSGSPHYRHVSDPQGSYLEIIGLHTAHETVYDSGGCRCIIHTKSHASPAFRISNTDNVIFGGINC